MWHKEGFVVEVVNCWEIQRFVSEPFSSYPIHLLSYNLSVEDARELRMEGKLKFYFWGLQLFCSM